MSKEIIYTLPYEKDGELKSIDIKINFVPNGYIKLYNEIMHDSFKIKAAWDGISDVNTKISALMKEQPEGFFESIEKLEGQKKELEQSILNAVDLEIEKRRIDLISILLKKNGYHNDFLHDYDFWEWSVEPGYIIDFMSTVAFKDIDSKKKLV